MADLYGQWVPDEWIEQVHAACRDNPQWQYIHLTKNPSRYAKHPPPPDSWVGTSVDEQKMVRIAEDAARRIDRPRSSGCRSSRCARSSGSMICRCLIGS